MLVEAVLHRCGTTCPPRKGQKNGTDVLSEEDRSVIQWALDEVRRETASGCPFTRGADGDCMTPILALTRGLERPTTAATAVKVTEGGREARVLLGDGSALRIRLVRRWFRAPTLEVSAVGDRTNGVE